MIKKYKNKPKIIEAVKWNGRNRKEVELFLIDTYLTTHFNTLKRHYKIRTPEGNMIARKGDYIIKGIHGEFYPCKPDIFLDSYEEIEQ